MANQGFSQVHHLGRTDRYEGHAGLVLLVWSDNQLTPAEQFRGANYANDIVDIAVCEDPTVQKSQHGDKAIIYNF